MSDDKQTSKPEQIAITGITIHLEGGQEVKYTAEENAAVFVAAYKPNPTNDPGGFPELISFAGGPLALVGAIVEEVLNANPDVAQAALVAKMERIRREKPLVVAASLFPATEPRRTH
jgi:hypothetical protein